MNFNPNVSEKDGKATTSPVRTKKRVTNGFLATSHPFMNFNLAVQIYPAKVTGAHRTKPSPGSPKWSLATTTDKTFIFRGARNYQPIRQTQRLPTLSFR
jgi:hypothetical protein